VPPLPEPGAQRQAQRNTATEGIPGAAGTEHPGRPDADSRLDAESAASFPASDPPSDWAGADLPPRRGSGQAMA
jgi:hypothetical protein